MSNKNIASLTVRNNGMNLGWSSNGPRKLGQVEVPDEYYNRIYTDIEVIDNLLNGMIPGSVVTIGASRGCGKTTFLMQLSQAITDKYDGRVKTLYLSNEEDITQLAFTAERIGTQGIEADNCTFVEDVIGAMDKYNFIVVDSLAGLQTRNESVNKNDIEMYSIQNIYRKAKQTKTVVFLVQHMTKAGTKGNNLVAAGKCGIEHTADACIKMAILDQEEFPRGRKIIVDKNRMGSCGEVWLEMGKDGFNFQAPINDKSGNDKDARPQQGGQRAEKAAAEMSNLVEFLKHRGTIKEIDLVGWNKLPSDPTALDRHSRLLRKMVKFGKVCKIGDQFSLVP